MTVTAPARRTRGPRPRRVLWRLDPSRRGPRAHPTPGGRWSEPEDFELCLALVYEAIARAEGWCARRERALAEFDLRAVDMVRGLRVAGVLPPSTTWDIGDGDAARASGANVSAPARKPRTAWRSSVLTREDSAALR